MSKVFEILLKKQIYNYFESNSLFTNCQYGFRTSHSTVEAVVSFVKRCFVGIENGYHISSSFYDFSKAFDTVSHETLLLKLKYYGFNGLSVKFLASYLNDRHQSVLANGKRSQYQVLKHGVPQGSILGPLLFIIYVNDLPDYIRDGCSESFMFADDLAVNTIHKNSDILSMELADVSSRVVDWCSANNLMINSNKTVKLNFGINRLTTVSNTAVRFLGIFLEPRMGWKTHVDYVAKKLSKGLYMLRLLRNNLPNKVLFTIFHSHIQSHLNYGIILWGHHTSAQALFILQKKALRLIYGVPNTTHCKPLFIRSQILTLPSMYVLACLLYIRNNINNYIACTSVHKYSTRNNTNLYIDKCKYSITQNSFLFFAFKLFNSLPVDIRNLPFRVFRTRIRTILLANPLYDVDEFFNIHVS